MSRPTVILRNCPDYDVDRIESIVSKGLQSLDLTPFGRTLVKPNCVASGAHFPHAYTREEFLEGVLRAVKARGKPYITELAIGERCGITVPTRFAFKGANYPAMVRRVGDVRTYHFDETPQVQIPLYHQGRLRDSFFTPEPIAKADFFVNCPKFKAHPWTTVTFSMKNYIGIQDDRHRLIDHDHRLDEKVADLQYIVQPQFIAIDAITAGEGRMLTPIPFPLGLVLMGNNQVAFDAVCCHIIGVDPLSVEHIRLAHQRGFGPVDLDEIHIGGDVSLDEARERARGFQVGLIRVEDYFQGTKIKAYGGRPPTDGGALDYCWGGCPGAFIEAIEVLRLFDESTDDKIPAMHVLFGQYDKPIQAAPGEPIIFVGDCAAYAGSGSDGEINISSIYQDRSTKDPLDAPYEDIFVKMLKTRGTMKGLEGKSHIRLAGCPVSVAEQILMLVTIGGLKNPYMDRAQVIPFVNTYLSWRIRKVLGWLMGGRYNMSGPTQRGAARPPQNAVPHDVMAALEYQD